MTTERRIEDIIKRRDPRTKGSEWDIIHADLDRKTNKFRHRRLLDDDLYNRDWPEASEEDE